MNPASPTAPPQSRTHSAEEMSPDEYRDVILQACELGARKIILIGKEPAGAPRIQEMIRFIHDNGMKAEHMANNDVEERPDSRQCLLHQFACHVNCYGEVVPCIGVDLVVGNVRESKLADIIRDSEVLQDLRNYRSSIKGPCAVCDQRETCYGCRGAAYRLTGDYLASDPACRSNWDKIDEIERLPMPADGLIPQRAPMKLVDTLLSIGERTAEVEVKIAPDCIFLDRDGCLEPAAFMEIIAQSAALHNGFRTRHLAVKPEGFLLGAKKMNITGTARAGDRLVINLYKEAKLGGFGIVYGAAMKGDECVAAGEIKVYHKEPEAKA